MGWCELGSHSVGPPFPESVGILKLVIALLYIVTVPIILFWIDRQRSEALRGHSDAVKAVIFPVFTNLLWLSALSSCYVGVLLMTISVRIGSSNSMTAIVLYSLAWAIQHAVIEGIAFMFLQRGCGTNAVIASTKLTVVWCLITFGLQLIVYQSQGTTAVLAQVVWSSFMLIFYFGLWLAPQSMIFRRPAAIQYAQFWFWFRLVTIVLYIFQGTTNPTLSAIGACGYILGPLLFFTLAHPFVCYWALLEDSRWWQGLAISQGSPQQQPGQDSIQTPLLGLDISYSTACELAVIVDSMSSNKATRLLNFAHIYLDKNHLLGTGSFSKVYRGKYLGKHCALKLLFTADLTKETIRRVAAEAALLSSVKSPNILSIFGVAVLPPSVCLVLELCAFGSLADIIHKNRQNGKELTLSKADRLYLGLGCARGLAALHALNPFVTHRDIKSFNFLVDSQLNAKLGDLELGQNSSENSHHQESASLLLNWAAPEVLQGDIYTQAADVYALGLVLWEIFSGQAPYDEEMENDVKGMERVKTQILSSTAYLPIPPTCPDQYSDCIERCWAKNPRDRCSAADASSLLVVAWQSCFTDDFDGLMFSSSPLTKMEQFFGSPRGVAFTDEINAQLNTLKAVDCISSLSVSSFESHGLLLSTMKQSFLWNSETSLATNTRISNTLHRSRSFCSGEGTLDTTTLQLQDLYRLFQNDSSWSKVDQVEESALIVTATAPHAIVKSSTAFVSLMGYAAENLFCHSLDHYVDYDASLFPEEHFLPRTILSEFYDSLATRGLGHMVLQLINSENEPLRCSVHGFAIGCPNISKDVRNTLRDSTYSLNYSESPATPTADCLKESPQSQSLEDQKEDFNFRFSRIPFPFLREESEVPEEDGDQATPSAAQGTAAFYAIYVSPLLSPKRAHRTRSVATSVSERVWRLISTGSSLGSGLKLSDLQDLERGPRQEGWLG